MGVSETIERWSEEYSESVFAYVGMPRGYLELSQHENRQVQLSSREDPQESRIIFVLVELEFS